VYKGNRYSVKDIAKITGLKERTVRGRFERGWSVEKVMETKKLKNQHT
jgi:DNA-directed RNA polymerase specialized sigma24 family protein